MQVVAFPCQRKHDWAIDKLGLLLKTCTSSKVRVQVVQRLYIFYHIDTFIHVNLWFNIIPVSTIKPKLPPGPWSTIKSTGSRADFGHTVAGLAVFWGGHVLFWCCQDFNDHMVSCFLNPLSKSFLWSFRIIPLWIYGMFRHTKWCLGKTWPFSQENQLQPWLPCRPSQTSALPFKEDDWVSNFFYGHCGCGMMKNHMNLSNVKFM